MTELFDTHCHIHSIGMGNDDFTAKKWSDSGVADADEVIESAHEAGVGKLICVGTGLEDSRRAIDFTQSRDNCYAAVGVHPHNAQSCFGERLSGSSSKRLFRRDLDNSITAALAPLESRGSKNPKVSKVVAIGEVGLDYYREHSPKTDQIRLLEFFLEQAVRADLPVIFHVREAHKDFWPIVDNFKEIRGVLHSFSATTRELEEGLKRDLHIGLNGIMTFTGDKSQLDAAKAVPLGRLLLETDAPYLTPQPFRGKICKPEHTLDIAKFLAELRGERLEELAEKTTSNACDLFDIAG